METEQELNGKILKITMTIQEKYPELSKYLGEMPVTISETNINNLRAHFKFAYFISGKLCS